MERICSRCVRLSVRTATPIPRARWNVAQFSTINHLCSNDASGESSREQGKPANQKPGQPAQSRPPRNTSAPDKPLLIRRVSFGENKLPERRPQNNAGTAQPRGTLQRSGPPGAGQVLRRSNGPQQPGQILRRRGGPPGQGQLAQNQQGKPRRRRRPDQRQAVQEGDDNVADDDEIDEYITKYIDRPDNPTETITYEPTAQTSMELQKDWPNTPLSSTGLTASLIQKIEWLARRLPHGYRTPGQIAEHLQKGELTRFESEEEKQLVIKIAADLANKRAGQLTERKGNQVEAEDMTFSDLSQRSEEKQVLVDSVVKGDVTQLQKQRMPFMDGIVRNLRNNGTYRDVDVEKFMTRMQQLMPGQKGPQAQKGV